MAKAQTVRAELLARVLQQLAERDGFTARDLQALYGVHLVYARRLLRKLTREGIVQPVRLQRRAVVYTVKALR